jgi:Fe-S-cluster-containing hydrogenase component 2
MLDWDAPVREMPIGVDEDRCRDCQACTLACSLSHEGGCAPSLARLSVTKDMARYVFHISVCHHCDEPACRDACPAGALSMDAGGVVFMDEEICESCGSCAEACPFDAIVYHDVSDRYLKCDLCFGRDEGPLCVAVCPVGALTSLIGTEEA